MQQYESKFEPAELEQIHANIAKLMAETMKLQAEAGKMNRERFLYPVLIGSSVFGVLATLAGVAASFYLKLHAWSQEPR